MTTQPMPMDPALAALLGKPATAPELDPALAALLNGGSPAAPILLPTFQPVSYTVPAELGSVWEVPTIQVMRRSILSVRGLEKEGKSHFGLTACWRPECCPVYYHNFDFGLEGVAERFLTSPRRAGPMYIANYRLPEGFADLPAEQKKVHSGLVYEKYSTAWDASLRTGKGTVVVDTHSEQWEVQRLAAFGKLTQVMPQHYGEVNADFRAQMREAYDSGMNFIFLQKLKKTYVNNNWNGQYEPAGFGDMGFQVQSNLYAYKDKSIPGGTGAEYKVMVIDCRQNARLNNQILPVAEFGTYLDMVFA